MTRRQAIKAKCLDCAGGSPLEVTLCQALDCPLWTFRLGQEPDSPTHLNRVRAALKKDPDMLDEFRDYYKDVVPKETHGFRGKNTDS